MESITVEYMDDIAILTLNKPDKLNIMKIKTLYEIKYAFENFMSSLPGVIIITGAGKAFCAGADIAEILELDYEGAKKYSKQGQRILKIIEDLPRPVIAALNGYTFGGGCELALACDMRIASEKIKIGQPEINLGIICGWGATQRLPRIVGKSKALKMIFGGDILNAAEAEKIGLVDMVVKDDLLMEEVIKFARVLREKPRIAIAETKKAMIFDPGDTDSGMDFEAECFANCFRSEDQKEGMRAFLEKRPPVFKGR